MVEREVAARNAPVAKYRNAPAPETKFGSATRKMLMTNASKCQHADPEPGHDHAPPPSFLLVQAEHARSGETGEETDRSEQDCVDSEARPVIVEIVVDGLVLSSRCVQASDLGSSLSGGEVVRVVGKLSALDHVVKCGLNFRRDDGVLS